VQNGLAARGGIFISRPRNTKKDSKNPEWKTHLDLRSRWRDAKIAASNNVAKLEELAKSKDREEGWEILDEAVRLWEQEAEKLAEVPGYQKEMSAEEVGDIVKRMMDELKNTLSGLVGPDEDGDSTMGNASDEEEDADVGDSPFGDSDVDTDSEDEGYGSEHPMAITDELQLQEAAPAGLKAKDTDDADEDMDDEDVDPPSPTDADMMDADISDADMADAEPAAGPADASPPTNNSKVLGKRVRISEYTKISPDALNFIPSLFPDNPSGLPQTAPGVDFYFNPYGFTFSDLSKEPLLRKHRSRVDADGKRRKSFYRHSGDNYRPGRWASPVGYEKANTSCYRMNWDEADHHWKGERHELREERRAYKQIKAISGAYVLTRILPAAWWAYQQSTAGGSAAGNEMSLDNTE
jgi:hypothetical protein